MTTGSAVGIGSTAVTTVGALTVGSLASGFTPVTVPLGGTGNTTFTAYSVICAGTTATGTFQNVSGVGTSGQILTSNGASALPTWQAAGGGSGSATTQAIHQVAHGFSVQQAVYLNSTTYTLAEANSLTAAEVVGLVTTVTDADHFTLTMSGYCTGFSGLTGGNVYWLSDSSAGTLTVTQPTTVGNVQKPLFIADSSTSGYLINYRGEIIPASSTQVLWNSISTNTNLVANTGYYITGGGALTLTLPTTAVAGSVIWIQGYGSTSWSIAANSGQNMYVGNTASTTTTGTVSSNNAHDGIYLVCVVANTTWQSTQYQGFLTVS